MMFVFVHLFFVHVGLLYLVSQCVQSFQDGRIPKLESTFDSMAEAECKTGFSSAIEVRK